MGNRSRVLPFALYALSIAAIGCGNDEAPSPAPESTVSNALTSIQNDWEDGTTQGWFPFGSPTLTSSTEQAFAGTRSLKTTNRTATFMGPATSLTGKLTPGTNYKVSVAARLVAGQAPTTLRVMLATLIVSPSSWFLFFLLVIVALAIGCMIVIPIGAADMPVVSPRRQYPTGASGSTAAG